jgi:phosphoenolpyruvate synthase/pyruvate phosphate dikinase
LFAGQQDTYLNVRGDALLDAVKRCWASLWNARGRLPRPNPARDEDLAMVVQTVINAAWGLGRRWSVGR